jgi:hypothetical protein
MAPKGKVKNASQKKSAAKPISGSVKKANKAPKFENGMDLGEWNRYATDKQKQRMNKRIEDGLKHMVQAISACPMTIAEILAFADKIEKDEIPVDDIVDGLMSGKLRAP